MEGMMRSPTTYEGWLARLFSSNDPEQMAEAASRASALCPDKKKARFDVAKILTVKYRTELSRGRENSIVEKTVKNKYNIIAKSLFGSSVEAMASWVASIVPRCPKCNTESPMDTNSWENVCPKCDVAF